VIVAAELTQDAGDFQQLAPMLDALTATLAGAGIAERPGTLAADSGYWSIAVKSDGLRAAITAKLQSEHGKACCAKRKEMAEPVFGQIKDGRSARRFMRRGLAASEAEWKLLCGIHNLLKLWRHMVIRPAPMPAIA
jgi:hypothetical protein